MEVAADGPGDQGMRSQERKLRMVGILSMKGAAGPWLSWHEGSRENGFGGAAVRWGMCQAGSRLDRAAGGFTGSEEAKCQVTAASRIWGQERSR